MVAEGYKQTDIGVIPEDWDVKSYEEVFKFLTTATYSRADLNSNGNIQYLHYGDIHTKYHSILDISKIQLPTITKEQLKKYPLLQNGDVVMADASEDYEGICKSIEIINLKKEKVIAGLHTFLLRDKNDVFVGGFIGYMSGSSLLKNQFDRLATGMKVYGVSKNNLKIVQIPIPPKQEQKAIAIALSDTDGLIDALEKLIAKKEAIKTGTMQQLLTGNKRLDGFSGEWVEKRLGELSIMFSGGTPSSKVSKYYNGKIKWVSISDMTKAGKYLKNTEKHITEIGLENSSAKIFKQNTLLLAMYASIGKCCIAINEVSTSQAILGISTKKPLLQEYLYYYLVFNQKHFINQGQQGTQSNLNKEMVQETLLNIPKDIEEQKAIATILSDMDKEIETLKSKLTKLKAIKEGMMQELLSGKTRLLGGEDE